MSVRTAAQRRSPAVPVARDALGRPHVALAIAVLATLLLEGARGSATTPTFFWPTAEAVIAGAALSLAWRRQHELRLPAVLALGMALQLGWILVHVARGVAADYDSVHVFPREGNALLHGTYPQSEYPPGAVLLFALDAWLGDGGTRVSHAFVMVPFQAASIVAVWLIRSRWSAWFAAFVALWPLNAFYWEFKFDLAPTAVLVVGLLLAVRDRWTLSGVALGLGAGLKWTPALAVLALAVWLARSARWAALRRHVTSAIAAFVALNLPFLVWSPHAFFTAYRIQGERGIIGESIVYLPLRALGLAHAPAVWAAATAPAWAKPLAAGVQAAVVIATLLLAAAVRDDVRAAVAMAAMCPVAFLITNRVFSPQYLVLCAAAWALAGSLVVRTAREQLALGALAAGATLFNFVVYPMQPHLWLVASALLFTCGIAASVLVCRAALSQAREQAPP